MRRRFGRRSLWLALLVALLALGVGAPLAGAAGPRLHTAPISPEFLRYRADLKVDHMLGLDRLPGRPLGMIPAPLDMSYLEGARIAPARAAYPSTFDLRSSNKVSPVKNQNPYGACWTFATFASMESCLLPGELRDFSEDNLVLNAGFDNAGDPYDHGGNYHQSCAYLIRWSGPVDESQDAYGDSSTPPGLSAQKHVQEVLFIPGSTSGADTSNVKYALTTYGAVATVVSWQDSAYNAATGCFYYGGSATYNHGVTIVGWDDNVPASSFSTAPPGNGAWLVKNSWGPGWGQSGYFWASYYDTYCGAGDAINAVFNGVEPTTNYSDLYSYDPLGMTSAIGYVGKETGWGANVFTATKTSSIQAIGFFTRVPNATYTVYAGASLQSLQAKGSGSIAVPGFHTVKLSSPMSVSSGDSFVAAVKVTTPNSTTPIVLETAVPGFSSGATASPGQSFISPNGSSWEDITTVKSSANVCVKAYGGGSGPLPTDTTPPVTTASGYDSAWHSAPVTVTFSATDPAPNASGVAYTEYRLDGGDWTKGAQVTVPAPSSTKVTHTVGYRSKDNAGNLEAEKTCQVKIDTTGGPPPTDTTPPVTTASGYDASWHRKAVTVTFSAYDPGSDASGVDYTEYRVDGGGWTRGDQVTVGAPPSGGGTRVVDYRSVDRAGNVEGAASCQVKIDAVGPVCEAKSARVKRGRVADVRFSVADNVSPQIQFVARVQTFRGAVRKSISSGGWQEANHWWKWTFPSTGLKKGSYRIVVYAQDRAGNRESVAGSATLTVR